MYIHHVFNSRSIVMTLNYNPICAVVHTSLLWILRKLIIRCGLAVGLAVVLRWRIAQLVEPLLSASIDLIQSARGLLVRVGLVVTLVQVLRWRMPLVSTSKIVLLLLVGLGRRLWLTISAGLPMLRRGWYAILEFVLLTFTEFFSLAFSSLLLVEVLNDGHSCPGYDQCLDESHDSESD